MFMYSFSGTQYKLHGFILHFIFLKRVIAHYLHIKDIPRACMCVFVLTWTPRLSR